LREGRVHQSFVEAILEGGVLGASSGLRLGLGIIHQGLIPPTKGIDAVEVAEEGGAIEREVGGTDARARLTGNLASRALGLPKFQVREMEGAATAWAGEAVTGGDGEDVGVAVARPNHRIVLLSHTNRGEGRTSDLLFEVPGGGARRPSETKASRKLILQACGKVGREVHAQPGKTP
jgi:hypothetical protein